MGKVNLCNLYTSYFIVKQTLQSIFVAHYQLISKAKLSMVFHNIQQKIISHFGMKNSLFYTKNIRQPINFKHDFLQIEMLSIGNTTRCMSLKFLCTTLLSLILQVLKIQSEIRQVSQNFQTASSFRQILDWES